VLFFRRIFNFEKTKVAEQLEHRLNRRYTPGVAFSLTATLTIDGRDWPAAVQNVSGGGVGLFVGSDAALTDGQIAQVRLVLAEHLLELDARLAHRKPQEKGIYCGMQFTFADSAAQKAYLQLLQPIIIGQSLKPVPADRVIQNEPQFIKQVYRGESDSVLTVWLANTTGTPLHSFEFQVHDYFCRATLQFGVLEVHGSETVDAQKAKMTNPVFDTSGGLEGEIRQLFRWIVPNLASTIPEDVRVMLQGFASK
jgi:hypothetical protein